MECCYEGPCTASWVSVGRWGGGGNRGYAVVMGSNADCVDAGLSVEVGVVGGSSGASGSSGRY